MDKPELVPPFTLQVGLSALLVIAFERICGGRQGAVDIWEVVCLVKRINLTSTLTHLLAVLGFGAEGRGSKGGSFGDSVPIFGDTSRPLDKGYNLKISNS